METKTDLLAAMAIELYSIENAMAESRNWVHEGLCFCDQCLYELNKQRKLFQARNRVLAEIAQLEGEDESRKGER